MPHRKIYREHYGPIPKEPNGRSYHIHHIDGDHSNNSPKNLRAVTVKEHRDIHKAQGDHYAALRLSSRHEHTGEELSELARIANNTLIAEGRHNWCNDGEYQRSVQEQLIKEGRYNFANQVAKGTHPTQIKLSCVVCKEELGLTGYKHHYRKQHNIILPPTTEGSRHSKRRSRSAAVKGELIPWRPLTGALNTG